MWYFAWRDFEKITKDYKEEEEENEINIKYKEYGKKIKEEK